MLQILRRATGTRKPTRQPASSPRILCGSVPASTRCCVKLSRLPVVACCKHSPRRVACRVARPEERRAWRIRPTTPFVPQACHPNSTDFTAQRINDASRQPKGARGPLRWASWPALGPEPAAAFQPASLQPAWFPPACRNSPRSPGRHGSLRSLGILVGPCSRGSVAHRSYIPGKRDTRCRSRRTRRSRCSRGSGVPLARFSAVEQGDTNQRQEDCDAQHEWSIHFHVCVLHKTRCLGGKPPSAGTLRRSISDRPMMATARWPSRLPARNSTLSLSNERRRLMHRPDRACRFAARRGRGWSRMALPVASRTDGRTYACVGRLSTIAQRAFGRPTSAIHRTKTAHQPEAPARDDRERSLASASGLCETRYTVPHSHFPRSRTHHER